LVFDGSAQIPVDMTGAKSIGLGVAEFPRFQTSAAAMLPIPLFLVVALSDNVAGKSVGCWKRYTLGAFCDFLEQW